MEVVARLLAGTQGQRERDSACREAAVALGVDDITVTVLQPGGYRSVAAASSQTAVAWQDAQFLVGEGPVQQALGRAADVVVSDLAREVPSRWPLLSALTPELAHPDPYRSLTAVPLEGADAMFAVVAAYGQRPLLDYVEREQLGVVGQAVLLAFARQLLHSTTEREDRASRPRPDEVGPGLRGSGAPDEIGGHDDDPRHAVETLVTHATGMVIAQCRVDATEALMLMRASSIETGRPLLETARAIISRRLRLGPQPDPRH